ncbi:hypothetical protein [Allorhodopirellula solitaria]|uniref:Polymerase nucleotidyl transferase domain-containing protein n=1 Tax=Allorhodopirellula solitaria TaxID=2527987 RepID=A0A5C5XYG0_9BACT|nr:hypothetical protein [Allorhodopirellula solitaria]TWT67571.1 hypothetical protein CA85_24240 [Allorhodopirellula solitaria]
MPNLDQIQLEAYRRLETAGIAYTLVGSMAGNYWGVSRSTHDIDSVIEYDETPIDAIIQAF